MVWQVQAVLPEKDNYRNWKKSKNNHLKILENDQRLAETWEEFTTEWLPLCHVESTILWLKKKKTQPKWLNFKAGKITGDLGINFRSRSTTKELKSKNMSINLVQMLGWPVEYACVWLTPGILVQKQGESRNGSLERQN